MHRRTAWITTISIIVAIATSCGSEPNDPFIDVSAGAEPLVTVGSPGDSASLDTAAATPTMSQVPITAAVSATSTSVAADPVLETAELAFGETADAAVACLAIPAACDPASVAAPGGPAHERFAKLVAVFHDNGYVVRHLPDVTHWTVESGEAPAPDIVVATVCDVDGDVVVEPGDTNGYGVDLVVNDLVVARRVRVELRDTAAGWRRWSVEQLGEWPMEATCGVA